MLHLISSLSLAELIELYAHAYNSIKSIDCILLSSFEFKSYLLIPKVKALRLSLLNIDLMLYF